MKKLVLIFLILLVKCRVNAQDDIRNNSISIDTSVLFFQKGKLADAVRKRIFSSTADSDRVWQYYLLSQQNTFINADSALTYSRRGLDLAKKIQFEPGEYYCNQVASWNLIFDGNYTGSLSIEFELSKKLEKASNSYRKAWNLQDIGFAYLMGGDDQTALTYLHQAWEIFKPYVNSFPFTGQVILRNTGKAYKNLNKLDSAFHYHRESYVLDSQTKQHWSSAYIGMGEIYTNLGSYEMGLDFYRKGFLASTYLVDMLDCYNGMATIFEKRGLIDSAVFYARKSISEGKNFPFAVIPAYTMLGRIYNANRVFDSAFRYQQLAYNLKDSILNRDKSKQLQYFLFSEQQRRQEIKEANERYEIKIRMYLMSAVLVIVLMIAFLLWKNNRNKQKANTLLRQQKEKVESTLSELKSTQAQLVQSEKMASLGELTAGIAHEIQNPLNFVNNFSEVNGELISELVDEVDRGNYGEVRAIAVNIRDNEEKIKSHGKRADAIVKGMLQHSRSSGGQKEPTDINALCDEYLRLAYHGMRAKDSSFNAKIETNFDKSIGKINIVPQEIGRVILNLINNGFYAASLPSKGGFADADNNKTPTVWVSTKKDNNKILISVKDNGPGIPANIIDKIFQPFFTTKPTGQGTGLGLSISYDIIKAHRGDIKLQSKEREGTEFIFELPLLPEPNI